MKNFQDFVYLIGFIGTQPRRLGIYRLDDKGLPTDAAWEAYVDAYANGYVNATFTRYFPALAEIPPAQQRKGF